MENNIPIKVEDIIPTILEIVPSIKDKWDNYYQECYMAKESELEPYYNERLYLVDLDTIAEFILDQSRLDFKVISKVFKLCEKVLTLGNEEVRQHIFLFIEELTKNMSPEEINRVFNIIGDRSKEIIFNIDSLWRKVGENLQEEKAEFYAQLEREYEERTGKKYPFPVYNNSKNES